MHILLCCLALFAVLLKTKSNCGLLLKYSMQLHLDPAWKTSVVGALVMLGVQQRSRDVLKGRPGPWDCTMQGLWLRGCGAHSWRRGTWKGGCGALCG